MGEKDVHAAAERVRPVKSTAKSRQMERLNRGLVAVKTKKGFFQLAALRNRSGRNGFQPISQRSQNQLNTRFIIDQLS